MSIADFPELQKLTPQEKLLLISDLWESVRGSGNQPLLSEEDRRILDTRIAEHERDPGSALTLPEFKSQLGRRLGKRL